MKGLEVGKIINIGQGHNTRTQIFFSPIFFCFPPFQCPQTPDHQHPCHLADGSCCLSLPRLCVTIYSNTFQEGERHEPPLPQKCSDYIWHWFTGPVAVSVPLYGWGQAEGNRGQRERMRERCHCLGKGRKAHWKCVSAKVQLSVFALSCDEHTRADTETGQLFHVDDASTTTSVWTAPGRKGGGGSKGKANHKTKGALVKSDWMLGKDDLQRKERGGTETGELANSPVQSSNS